MTDRLLVIADDLTGALDTAVQFSRAGVTPFVTLQDAQGTPDEGTPVLAVDIESRHLPPAEAADRLERCVRAAAPTGMRRYYKKTDSTLRGNVGAELAALLRATGIPELYFVPALPDAGRITRGGVPYVDGVPLHRSRYARDAVDPVRGVSVVDIIASQTDTAVVCVPRGADHVPLLARATRPAIVVFDAETNGDLEAIAGRLAESGTPRLLAGCAGFASVLPGLLGVSGGTRPAPALRRPLLVVCGSRDEVSRRQLREAEAGSLRCWSQGATDPTPEVVEALRREGAAILVTGDSLAAACGTVRLIVDQVPVGSLAVFGGDTAYGVLRALGVNGLRPVGEICQGVVVTRLEAARGSPDVAAMHLVTKAGGFGPVDVIRRIRDALEREE